MTDASTDWTAHLQHLVVDVGAELLVADPDDDRILYAAPVARAWRVDDDDRRCIWLRPLSPSIRGRDGTTVFALNQCRPRALHVTAGRRVGDELVLDLHSGQRARLRPAVGPAAAWLERWDTFLGARLTAEEEFALDALAEDSWIGRYA